jgi:hypothetical protein
MFRYARKDIRGLYLWHRIANAASESNHARAPLCGGVRIIEPVGNRRPSQDPAVTRLRLLSFRHSTVGV